MTFQLVIVGGGQVGRTYLLDTEDVTIGRDKTNTVVLGADRGVSRNHARFFVRDDMLHVVDLGSSNGTKVNDTLISAPAQLRIGDLVTIGSHTFQIATPADQGNSDETMSLSTQQIPPMTQVIPTQQPQQPQQPIAPSSQPTQAWPQQSQPQPYYPQQPPPGQPQQVNVTVKSNMTGLWIFLCIVALGPCGIFCLGMTLLVVLPYIMVIGGLVFGILGAYNHNRYRNWPGWESQASKGLAMCIGGFASAVLGAVWIIAVYGTDTPGFEPPSAEPASSEDAGELDRGSFD